jgi:hypothetical protein
MVRSMQNSQVAISINNLTSNSGSSNLISLLKDYRIKQRNKHAFKTAEEQST